MRRIAIVGTGFVADLYMRSFELHDDVTVALAYDRDPVALARFCAHYEVEPVADLDTIVDDPSIDLVLNLTNPGSHHEVSRACLEGGKDVYSEKPLAMTMDHAYELRELADRHGRLLGSAPCSFLSETAQTLGRAIRTNVAGTPYLVYAELDDGLIPHAPTHKWASESGAPWPAEDEFEVGCTLEHAGYYLTWLMASFGSVRTVVAASADLVDGKLPAGRTAAPDYSTAILFFESGMVARLTCSIVAPHDHGLRVFAEKGILEIEECWNNDEPVRFRRRHRLRRRLLTSPYARKIKLEGPTHPKVTRKGAAAMNFALGPVEMLDARLDERPCRVSLDFALHLTEVSLAIQNAGEFGGAQEMKTRMKPVDPMPWAR